MEEILNTLILLGIDPNSKEKISTIIKKGKLGIYSKYSVEQFIKLFKIQQLIKNGIVSSEYGKVIEDSYIRHLEIEKELETISTNNTAVKEKHLDFIKKINTIFVNMLNKYHIINYNIDYQNITDEKIVEEFKDYQKDNLTLEEIYEQLRGKL